MAEIDILFTKLVELRGSDLHLSAGRPPMIRIHGDIQPIDFPEMTPDMMSHLLTEIMPERNRKEFAERNDTDFAYEIPDLARFRSNIFQDISGMGGVFRVIPSKIITAEELKLPKSVTNLGHLSKGLVLVTGPTGSGKSTTLAALVDLVNRLRSDHIITVEDPIEFVHKDKKCLVNQREVHSHTESFASAIRAALRQDPDIVLVGEMRDLETIETAIETAETGHLVFGTLHTTTAASTVDRIIDSFPANRQNQVRAMLSISLKGVIAQTLCKRLDNQGRIAALEVLIVTPPIAALIRDSKTFQIPSAMQVAGAQGMILMNDSLFKLVKEGVVDAREAYIKAVDKDGLIAKCKSAGITLPPLEQTGENPSTISPPSTVPTPSTPSPVRKKGFFG